MVSDESDNAVSGASVKIVGDTVTRTVETNDRGQARFIRLEPGSYTIEVEKQGFNIAVYQNVRLNQSATAAAAYQSTVACSPGPKSTIGW